MTFSLILFYILAALILFGAVKTVTAKNPVHAALYLVLTFCMSAMMWMLMQAEFLGITLVVVYVGAVMVLFLFVVMLLDIDLARLREGFWSYLPMGAIVALLIVGEMGLVLYSRFAGVTEDMAVQSEASFSNVQAVGRLLFTEYVYPFELASVILLVGIVAAVSLTLRGKRANSKAVSPSEQVFVKAQDCVRLLKMPAEKQD